MEGPSIFPDPLHLAFSLKGHVIWGSRHDDRIEARKGSEWGMMKRLESVRELVER